MTDITKEVTKLSKITATLSDVIDTIQEFHDEPLVSYKAMDYIKSEARKMRLFVYVVLSVLVIDLILELVQLFS